MMDFAAARAHMVDSQMRTAGVTDYRVLLFPVDRERWAMVAGSPSALPRLDGTFKLSAVPPGEYFVALIRTDALPPFGEVAGYERLAKTAQRVTLTDDEQKEIELTIPR